MPKKKSSEKEQEVLGQIFDFIFKEAKKKPAKRKPIKYTGISGQSLLTSSLVAALEKPGAFITEQSVKDFGDALDVTLTKIKTDDAGVSGVKLSLGKAVDIFKDPTKAFEKAVEGSKAFRRTQRATYLGQSMREMVANGWARRYADLDTQIAVRLGLASNNISKNKERITTQGAIGQSAAGRGAPFVADAPDLMNRAGILLGRQTFGEATWNRLSESKKEEFLHMFAIVDKDSSAARDSHGNLIFVKQWQQQFIDEFGATQGNFYFDNFKRVALGSKGISDVGFYRKLEVANIDSRIALLQGQRRSALRDEQIATLQKAKVLITGQDLSPDNVRSAMQMVDTQIADYKQRMQTTRDANVRARYKNKLDELKGDKRQLYAMVLGGKVGEIEGYWNSYQNIWGANLVGSILNGNFFDTDQNTVLNPADTEVSVFDGKLKYVVNKASKNPLENKYNEVTTAIYYFTPRAWIRTFFFNGEAFGYFMSKNRKGIEGIIGNSLDNQTILDLLGDNGKLTAQRLMRQYGNNPKLQSMLNQFMANGKRHKIFSFNARMKNVVAARFEVFLKRYRSQFAKALMKSPGIRKVFSGTAAKLLGQWVSKGGIRTFVTAMVRAALNALGFVTLGPAANTFVYIATDLLMDAVYAVGAVLFSIIIYALIGAVAVLVIGVSGTSTLLHQTFSYTNEVPGTIITNPDYQPDSGTDDPGSTMTIYHGNAMDIYNSVRAEMGLSTNLYLVTCPGGQMCDKIAWAWCYSGGTGIYCDVNKIAKGSDAGLTKLFRHELIHQMQQGAGPDYLHEWGADFLSDNGGGYCFLTRDGVRKATATGSYLLSTRVCTQASLKDVALNKPSAVNSPCGAIVTSYVTDFAVCQ